jgi:hypothetical protein
MKEGQGSSSISRARREEKATTGSAVLRSFIIHYSLAQPTSPNPIPSPSYTFTRESPHDESRTFKWCILILILTPISLFLYYTNACSAEQIGNMREQQGINYAVSTAHCPSKFSSRSYLELLYAS